MLTDAAGNHVPSDTCTCGRHKIAAKPKRCVLCDGASSEHTAHSAGCRMLQDAFSPTGVVFSPALPLHVRGPRSKAPGKATATHCGYGHPRDVYSNGQCKQCVRESHERRARRQKEEALRGQGRRA